jgi:hypothetical protein
MDLQEVGFFEWVWELASHIQGGTQAEGFENRVLRGIFGPKRDEVTEEWTELHNEELNDLYCHWNFSLISGRTMALG